MSHLRAAGALLLALAAASPLGAQAPADSDASGLLRRGGIVWHYAPEDERLARRLATITESAPPLPALPADVFTAPIDVYLAPDERAFVQLSGGSPPEWGAGIALLGDSVQRIVLPGYASGRVDPSSLPRVLRHELAHVALHRYLGDARVPRWFHEGYARWAAGELDFEAAWQLRLAFATGAAPPLDSLALDWPAHRLDAGVAYLLAASTIDYLVSEGGIDGLRIMLERWRATGDLDDAMRATYGVTQGQFEEHWRRHVKRRYGWALVLTHSVVFWAIVAVLVGFVWLRRRRRDRLRLERMVLTDPPDQPDWWMEREEPPGLEEARRPEEPPGPPSGGTGP